MSAKRKRGWRVEVRRDSGMVRYNWLGNRKPDGWEAAVYRGDNLVGYEWAETEEAVLAAARKRKSDVLEQRERERARKVFDL